MFDIITSYKIVLGYWLTLLSILVLTRIVVFYAAAHSRKETMVVIVLFQHMLKNDVAEKVMQGFIQKHAKYYLVRILIMDY